MHRDERSAWQAGSYSFLTPACAEWCNTTAGPPPSLSSCPSSPASLSQSPLCTLPHRLLISLSPRPPIYRTLPLFIIPFPVSPPPPPLLLSLLLFTGSLSFSLSISLQPRGPCFLACITHNYFHPSIICLLLFSYPTSLSLLYDNNPHSPAYTCFFATPISHLPPLGSDECTSFPPSPSPPFFSLPLL